MSLCSAPAFGQQRQRIVEALHQLLYPERRHARGGEFYCERVAVEVPAQRDTSRGDMCLG
jgi:hypothetical protein